MKTCYNLNPAHKNTNATVTKISLGVPPEQKSVNRHGEKEPLDKDLEDPCRKFNPFMGCPNSQKLRRRFETHIEKGHSKRYVQSSLCFVSYYFILKIIIIEST